MDRFILSRSTVGIIYWKDEYKNRMEDRVGELLRLAFKMLHEDVATVQIYTATDVYRMNSEIEFTPTKKNRESLMLIKDVKVRN